MSSHSPRAASSASSPPSYSASEAAQGDQQHQRRDRTKKKKKKSEEELSPEALLRSRARIGLREAYGSAIGDIEAKGIPVRLRQHVNPLRKDFQIPTPAPEWERVYANPLRPLVVDVGCGPGRLLLKLAANEMAAAQEAQKVEEGADVVDTRRNFLGLEIRQPIVQRAVQWSEKLGLASTTHFLLSNATVSIGALLASYPGEVSLVCVQFPDPHFKRRHRKRRIVQPSFVDDLRKHMRSGSAVYLSSDVHEVAEAMRETFERDGGDAFELDTNVHDEAAARIRDGSGDAIVLDDEWVARRSTEGEQTCYREDGRVFQSEWRKRPGEAWLLENPLGVPTEREVLTTKAALPVYRALLRRL